MVASQIKLQYQLTCIFDVSSYSEFIYFRPQKTFFPLLLDCVNNGSTYNKRFYSLAVESKGSVVFNKIRNCFHGTTSLVIDTGS